MTALTGRSPTEVAVGRVFREASGQAVATLVRLFGDITLAEDAVQDAFAVATDRWMRDGVPPNPAGWIVTTARHRAIDALRRAGRGRELLESIGVEAGMEGDQEDMAAMLDDRLRLIFTCCHPALRPEHQMALTLRLLGGLGMDELARAFLVGEAAMAKRLVRAKYKIKAARIPYRVPTEEELPLRLQSVLSVLYLIYNAGFDHGPRGAPLRQEGIRLAETLVESMHDQPEAAGLLALMLLSEARVPARAAGGSLILLRDQDRTLWNRELIRRGQAIVRACIRHDRPGPYQLQAAIVAVHCSAESFDETDWLQIRVLYDHLYASMPTPVVALNRAVAVAEIDGPSTGLDLIDQLASGLAGYHLLHATRGAFLMQLGRRAEALAAFQRALELAGSDEDRRFLAERIDQLTDATAVDAGS